MKGEQKTNEKNTNEFVSQCVPLALTFLPSPGESFGRRNEESRGKSRKSEPADNTFFDQLRVGKVSHSDE